eukprot:Platyproteum_vivax@DN6547_c0_g1_i3.p1
MPSTGDLYAGPSSQRICHSKYANMYKSAWGDKEQYAHSVKFGQYSCCRSILITSRKESCGPQWTCEVNTDRGFKQRRSRWVLASLLLPMFIGAPRYTSPKNPSLDDP